MMAKRDFALLLLALAAASCESPAGVACFGLPSLAVSPSATTLRVSDAARLTLLADDCPGGYLRGHPLPYDGPVTWQSSDSTVVLVTRSDSAEVTIVGRALGTATVTGSPRGDAVRRASAQVSVGP